MEKIKKWIKISDNDLIEVGTLIQGYTYSIGDYHNNPKKVPEKLLGSPKLRKGIIIEVFSTKVFKVQFENSAALRPKFRKKSNVINYGFKSLEEKGVIQGTDAYCILLQREQIMRIHRESSFIIDEVKKLQTNIYSKHSREKKRTISYIQAPNFKYGLPKDKTDEIFEEWQFTKKEKELSHEKAWEKISLLQKRHNNNDCVKNEYKKIRNIHKFLNRTKLSSNEYSNYQTFLESALKEYSTARFARKMKETLELINFLSKQDIPSIEKYFNETFPDLTLSFKLPIENFAHNLMENEFNMKNLKDIMTKLVNSCLDNLLTLFKNSEKIQEHYLPNTQVIEKVLNFTITLLQQEINEINFENIDINKITKSQIENYFAKIFKNLENENLEKIKETFKDDIRFLEIINKEFEYEF